MTIDPRSVATLGLGAGAEPLEGASEGLLAGGVEAVVAVGPGVAEDGGVSASGTRRTERADGSGYGGSRGPALFIPLPVERVAAARTAECCDGGVAAHGERIATASALARTSASAASVRAERSTVAVAATATGEAAHGATTAEREASSSARAADSPRSAVSASGSRDGTADVATTSAERAAVAPGVVVSIPGRNDWRIAWRTTGRLAARGLDDRLALRRRAA